MSCTVTTKDVIKDVKNNYLEIHPTGKPSGADIFIPYTKKNRPYLFDNVMGTKREMDKRYHSHGYGEISTVRTEEFGIGVSIHPNPEIAEAMTYQNAIDDARAGNPEMFDSRHTSNINVKRPVTDNYIDFLDFKEKQLDKVNRDIRELNRLSNIPGANRIDIRKKLGRALANRTEIENQIDQLKEEEVDLMFHTIITDLTNIDVALEDIENTHIRDVGEKVKFYSEFITGKEYGSKENTKTLSIRGFDHPDYEKLLSQINSIDVKYGEKLSEFAVKIIEENDTYKRNISDNPNLSSEEVDSLFVADSDLNFLEKNYLGIGNSNVSDTIIPQVYMAETESIFSKEYSYVERLIQKLSSFLKESKIKDFDFIFETDKDGNRTGFITDVFMPQWFADLSSFSKLYKTFLKDKNPTTYRSSINWLQKNTDLIDMRKIKEFRGVYGGKYSGYFKYSDKEMDAYEAKLREKLGPRYEEVIKDLHSKLQNFEYIKEEQLNSENPFKHKNIAAKDLWAFTEAFYDKQNITKEIPYNTLIGVQDTQFTDFKDLSFTPKETKKISTDTGVDEVSTGYYSDTFKDIASDPNKLEYWNIIKEMSKYIDDTYQTEFYGRMSYPKVLKDYKQKLGEAWQDTKELKSFSKASKLLREAAHEYKNLFYEKGRHSTGNEVVANYGDTTNSQTSQLAQLYIQQGMSRQNAYAKAKDEILKKYSSDINRDIESTLMLAALHSARVKAEPNSAVLLEYFSNIKDINNNPRKNAIERFTNHRERIILNQTEKYRGTLQVIGKSKSDKSWYANTIKFLSKMPIINNVFTAKAAFLLNDVEKEVFKELQELQANGYNKEADFSVTLDDITYVYQSGEYYEVGEDGGLKAMPATSFNQMYQKYIEKKISDLGLDLNMAGVVQGVLKSLIIKGLGLNPASGVFNRMEGKHSGLIMDMTGYYWTKGNMSHANHFLRFANALRLAPEWASPKFMKRYKELDKLNAFGKIINTLQDRKNVLERSAEDSKFDTSKLNIFQFAVENPEFKNQMSIALSVMMDVDIVKNDGTVVPLFDGNEFPAHTLENGKLTLRPEFSNAPGNQENWGDFIGSELLDLQLKITNSVNKSQGNYNPRDVINITKTIYGRASMVFLNWFPEHVMQRFAKGEGMDLLSGKKKLAGRYTSTAKASGVGIATHVTAMMAVLWGFMGLTTAPVIGAGILGSIVYYKFFSDLGSKEEVNKEVSKVMDFVEYMKSVLAESLNYPLDMANISPGKKGQLRVKNKAFEHRNLSEEEINNMRALTKELAIVLYALGIKLGVAAMLWDEDDDEDSQTRMLYNFLENQMSRTIKTIGMYSDPRTFTQDMGRLALFGSLEELYLVLSMVWSDGARKNWDTNVLNVTPLPRTINKAITKGQYPGLDHSLYDEFPSFSQIGQPLKYSTDFMKDVHTEGEWGAKRDYNKLRGKELDYWKDYFKDAGYKGEDRKYEANKKMRELYSDKSSFDTYKKTLEAFELDLKDNKKKR